MVKENHYLLIFFHFWKIALFYYNAKYAKRGHPRISRSRQTTALAQKLHDFRLELATIQRVPICRSRLFMPSLCLQRQPQTEQPPSLTRVSRQRTLIRPARLLWAICLRQPGELYARPRHPRIALQRIGLIRPGLN